MTDLELKAKLTLMKARSAYVTGQIGMDGPGKPPPKPLRPELERFFSEALSAFDDPERFKAGQVLLNSVGSGDHEARTRLNSIRIMQATNYILASQNIIPFFFNTVILKDDERPAFQNNTIQEVKITYVSQDGSAPEVKVVKPQVEELIDLRILTTPEVKYRKMDIYNGNIINNALQTLRLSYDLANQMEGHAKTLLTGATSLGTFTFTGNKATRTYLANSRIKTALLPTTNDITVPGSTGSGATSKFRWAVFKEAEKYGESWGQAFEQGPLFATGRLLVPGSEASDLADDVTPSGDTANPVADDLLRDGWRRISYLGRTWIIVPDNTISPGACYVELNRKSGHVFLKPSMDKERVKDDYETDQRNEERRYAQKVFGGYINAVERMNFARIIYNTNYNPADP